MGFHRRRPDRIGRRDGLDDRPDISVELIGAVRNGHCFVTQRGKSHPRNSYNPADCITDMTSWKRDFGSGLIILVPLLVIIIVLAWIYGYLTRVPIPVDDIVFYGRDITEPVRVLLSLVIFVLLVFSVGYMMRTAVGKILERSLDDTMNHLPGLRVIYNASKMAVETALSGTGELQKPVRLEVWDGLRMTAFKTGNRAPDGREILFLPTAPNITTGFVVEVEEDRYDEIGDSVEDALTRLLSAGFGENEDRGAAGLLADDGRNEVHIDEIGQTKSHPETGEESAATGEGGSGNQRSANGSTGENGASDEGPGGEKGNSEATE